MPSGCLRKLIIVWPTCLMTPYCAVTQVLPPIVIVYLGAELIFAGIWKRKYDRFNKIPAPHAPQDPNFDPRSVALSAVL